jgi:signal recognition particle receptor subunit beta
VFKAYAETPYVVAANKQDLPDAWSPGDVRIALRIDKNIKVLGCVARDKETVKEVLLELLYSILENMQAEE